MTCLLFAMWFVSGLVMIYVPFPSLDKSERIARLAPIAFDQVRVQPVDAARVAGIADPQETALEMREGRAVWRIRSWQGAEAMVAADGGNSLGQAGQAEALRTAARFGQGTPIAIDVIERDQWTVAGGYDRYRPLWKVTLAGGSGRNVYVSARTGAVVLATTARERFWNWLGSVPHWIYPTILRQDNAAWRQVVMWVSAPCILGGITGMWIGILRVRLSRRRFRDDRVIPYRGWMAWHHVAGLFGGVALIAWIFSGWLSVDPFRIFASRGVPIAARQTFAGRGELPPLDLAALARVAPDARRIELSWAAGHPVAAVYPPVGQARLLDARSLRPVRSSPAELVARARRLMAGAPLRSVELLRQPDAYWYEIGGLPPLPVLRLRFDDPAATWLHLDPATGRFLGESDRRRRAYRWAFDLLHKWDLNALTQRRPLWDGLLWGLSALGLVTSISGIWIGWKRLSRPAATRGVDCRRMPQERRSNLVH